MKLLSNPASPFVRKVLVVASECGLTDQIQMMPLALTPVNPNADVVDQNPLGKIPALELDDGSTLFDSRVICEYLHSLGSTDLYGQGDQRWSALRLQAVADGICDAAVLVRYETFVKPAEYQWENWIEGQRNKYRRALNTLESELSGFKSHANIGTLSVAIAIDYIDFRYPDENWRDQCPKLAAWHDAFSNRPSLVATRPSDLKT